MEDKHTLKIVVIGDYGGVGKTSIIKRYVRGTFSHENWRDVGLDVMKKILLVNGKTVKLYIFDTAGQERFHSVSKLFYRGVDGVIIVYDVTNALSFANVERWLQEIKRECDEHGCFVFVGNKDDDYKKEHEVVTPIDARRLAAQLDVPIFFCSAEEDKQVNEIFTHLTEKILLKKYAAQEREL